MQTYTITLLRHGIAVGEPDGRYIGHTDVPLTKEGRLQLRRLCEEETYPSADAVFTSPLKRCTETAEILYPGKDAIKMDGLKEYFFGDYENKTPNELKKDPLFQRWISGEEDVKPPFAETLEDFQTRICGTFAGIVRGLFKTQTKNAVVITHGGIVMALMSAFALPMAKMHDWLTPSGCGYTLRLELDLWMRAQKAEAIAQAPFIDA